jgi:hypothetical protein
MATRALQVVITGDKTQFDRTMRGIDTTVDHSEKRMKRFAGVGSAAMKGIGLAAAAGAAVGLKQAASAAIEAEKSQARMVTQLKASGTSFSKHREEIEKVIGAHSRLSGLDDEDLQDSFTNIVRITGDVDKSLRLTGLAADFARAKHIDVAKAGEIVGKVAGGNTGILSRYGIQVEKGATAHEALGKLQEKFAGQAEAYGKTTQGSMDRASVAWENLLEVVGAKVAPVIQKAADLLSSLFDRTSKGNRVIRALGEAYVTYLGWVRDAIKSGIAWVKRFADRNREDIEAVVKTMRNLGRAAKWVFEEILVPVVKRALRVLQGVADGIVTAIRGLIRIVTGIFTGDWERVWDGFKDVARGAVKAVKSILGGLWRALRDTIKELVPLALDAAKEVGKAIIKGVVSGIKSAGSAVGNAISDVVGAVNPFGDGVGIGKRVGEGLGHMPLLGGSVPGGFGGNLDGADPHMKPFALLGTRFGLGVSDGLRPGGITSSGNVSLHATGDAIDVSGPASGMMKYFKYLRKNFGSRLNELIYTPGRIGIKNGQLTPIPGPIYDSKIAADHHDHVHVGFTGSSGDGTGHRRPRTGDGIGQAVQAAKAAGFRGQALINAVAIAGAESRYDAEALNPRYPDYSVGMWQINMLAHGSRYGSESALKNPFTNAKAAYAISGGGRNFGPWSTWPGLAKGYLARARAAASGAGSRGGTPGASGGGGGAAGPRLGTVGETTAGLGTENSVATGAAAAEVTSGKLAVARAKAEKRDDLSGLISVMQEERKVKRRRLRLIRKALRGRMNPKRRARLLNEEAQLIGEIGDLNDLLKEYKADRDAGATTISRADELEAGVDTSADTGSGAGEAPAAPEADPMVAVLAGLVGEQVQNQRRIIQLMQSQSTAIPAALAAMVDGTLGGKVGLGFSSVGYAGNVAAY